MAAALLGVVPGALLRQLHCVLLARCLTTTAAAVPAVQLVRMTVDVLISSSSAAGPSGAGAWLQHWTQRALQQTAAAVMPAVQSSTCQASAQLLVSAWRFGFGS